MADFKQSNAARDAAAKFRKAAKEHALDAVKVLADLAKEAKSETVRAAAAKTLIERAYGPPPPPAAPVKPKKTKAPEPIVITWQDPER